MALSTVNYTNPASGSKVVFYDDGSSNLTQGIYLCDPSAPGTPLTGTGGVPVGATQLGTWNIATVTTVTTCSTVTTLSQFGGNAINLGNGAVGTGTLRVTMANDSTGILAGVTTVTTLTGGGVAHDGVDSGNPVKVGAKAVSALSTATMVSAADRTDLTSDLDAAVIVRPQFPLGDIITERVTDTGGTSTAFSNFGATASTRSVITAITVYNSSATAGYVDFRDGTGGSVLYTVPLPAGGGAVLPAGATPYFRTSANTALAYDVSGALSTVYISITGFKSKV